MDEQYSSDIFQDVREEGAAFWSEVIPWPVDTREYIFIGRVINDMGRMIFPYEWGKSELVEIFLPKYLEESDFNFDKDSFEGKYLRRIVEAVEIDRGVLLHPREAFLYFIASDRAESLERIRAVVRTLLKAFISGDLKAFKQRIGGGVPFIEMDAVEWTRDDVYDWFAFCHDGHRPLPASWLKRNCSADTLPSHIFLSRASLCAFLNEWGSKLVLYQFYDPDGAIYQIPDIGSATATMGSEPPESSVGIDSEVTETDTQANRLADETFLACAPLEKSVCQNHNTAGFKNKTRDIHEAIITLWPLGDFPRSPGQLQQAVNKYLRTHKHYTTDPTSRTYERYFAKVRKASSDK